MKVLNEIYKNINLNNWKLVNELIKDNKQVNYNISINNIFIIELLFIHNKYELVEYLINNNNILFDIYDSNYNPIIFIPIKYNYNKLLNILLVNDKQNIGISFFDIRNKEGLNILLFAIKIKNNNAIKIINNNFNDFNIIDENGLSIFHYISKYSNLEILKLILKKNFKLLNKQNNLGETCLHTAINYNNNDIALEYIKYDINLDIKDYTYELTSINYAINNNNNILDLILEKKFNYNSQDYKGRNYLHYLIIFDLKIYIIKFIKLFNNLLNFNDTNIKGETPLHLLIKSYNDFNDFNYIIKILIKYTKLNIQDYYGNTCFYYFIKKNIWKNYKVEIQTKKLDIYIYNENNIQIINIVDKKDYEEFLDLIILSYLHRLKTKKKIVYKYIEYCRNNNSLTEFKTKFKKIYDKLKNKNNNNICYEVIKYHILKNKVSFPERIKKTCINIQVPKKISFVSYTGSNYDILCGLYYLEQNYDNVETSLTKNFIKNNQIEKYYLEQGKVIFSGGQEFYNLEILWIDQKLFLPSHFKDLFLNLKKRFLVIPIGIENSLGNHSNILIYDKFKKIIERFEPNGSSSPFGFYYNSSKLDELLYYELNFLEDIVYLSPDKYLPKIGLQLLESIETKKINIGDPGGFCSSWSLWYVTMVLKYYELNRKKLIYKLIYYIKKNQISFKDIIREFTSNIISVRNKFLKNTDITINNWINNDYNKTNYDKLVNNILKNIS